MSETQLNIIVSCPHCNDLILIEQLNCMIFRHGVLKSNNTQIDPHTNKADCDNYKNNDLIYGCGNPFKVIKNNNNEFQAIICEYI
jgi:hypothetical protein